MRCLAPVLVCTMLVAGCSDSGARLNMRLTSGEVFWIEEREIDVTDTVGEPSFVEQYLRVWRVRVQDGGLLGKRSLLLEITLQRFAMERRGSDLHMNVRWDSDEGPAPTVHGLDEDSVSWPEEHLLGTARSIEIPAIDSNEPRLLDWRGSRPYPLVGEDPVSHAFRRGIVRLFEMLPRGRHQVGDQWRGGSQCWPQRRFGDEKLRWEFVSASGDVAELVGTCGRGTDNRRLANNDMLSHYRFDRRRQRPILWSWTEQEKLSSEFLTMFERQERSLRFHYDEQPVLELSLLDEPRGYVEETKN